MEESWIGHWPQATATPLGLNAIFGLVSQRALLKEAARRLSESEHKGVKATLSFRSVEAWKGEPMTLCLVGLRNGRISKNDQASAKCKRLQTKT